MPRLPTVFDWLDRLLAAQAIVDFRSLRSDSRLNSSSPP